MSRPAFEWPEAWLVWLDMLDDGQRSPPAWIAEHATMDAVPDWIARWWLAFREWTHAGKLPDADALAADLEALLPELEAREESKSTHAFMPESAASGRISDFGHAGDDPRSVDEMERDTTGALW
jgi:hypothetical protein